MKVRKEVSNLSNNDGERAKSPPPRTVTGNLGVDNGGEGKKSDGDKGDGRSDNWVALGDTDGSGSQ